MNNRDEVLEAVKQDGMALKYASDELKNDREIVMEAVRNSETGDYLGEENAIQFASDELKNDYEMAKFVLKKDYCAFNQLGPNIKKNRDILLLAFEEYWNNGDFYELYPDELLEDEEIMLKAAKEDYTICEYVSKELKASKKFFLDVLKQNGMALEFADIELKKDREIVLEAVKQNGMALEFADIELKKDREIVLTAVRSKGSSLKYADFSCQDDLLVVLDAIYFENYYKQQRNCYEQRDYAIKYASPRIREYIRTHDVGFDTHWQECEDLS